MRSKRVKSCVWVLILAFVPLLAADFWEKKEYTNWSEKECMQLLRKSPWAFSESFRTTSNLGSTETGVRETTEIIEFRLLTARPVRMAFGQLQMLQNPGNESLKEQIQGYVAAPPGDEIMVQVSYRTIPSGGFMSHLHAFFARATLATFANTTYLITADGENISMSKFLPWNEERPNAIFVFPRLAQDGTPHFTGKDKSITLRSEFDLEAVPMDAVRQDRWGSSAAALGRMESSAQSKRKYKIHVKMKPKDMVYQGELEL